MVRLRQGYFPVCTWRPVLVSAVLLTHVLLFLNCHRVFTVTHCRRDAGFTPDKFLVWELFIKFKFRSFSHTRYSGGSSPYLRLNFRTLYKVGVECLERAHNFLMRSFCKYGVKFEPIWSNVLPSLEESIFWPREGKLLV